MIPQHNADYVVECYSNCINEEVITVKKDNPYYMHLYNGLMYNKNNSIIQKDHLKNIANTNDNYDYMYSIENWYAQVFELICVQVPDFYVNYMTIYEDDKGNTIALDYVYYDVNTSIENISNNINISISKNSNS